MHQTLLAALIRTTQNSIDSLIAEFEPHITNQTIPLEERWKFFIQAPDWMKKNSDSIEHFDSLQHFQEDDRNIAEDSIYSYLSKGEILSTDVLIDGLLENMNIYEEGNEYRTCLSLEDVTNLQEEILRKNLKGITFDW
jgi:hypothetical protein